MSSLIPSFCDREWHAGQCWPITHVTLTRYSALNLSWTRRSALLWGPPPGYRISRYTPSVCLSIRLSPSTRKRKSTRHLNFDERLSTSRATGRPILRDGHISCRHGPHFLVFTTNIGPIVVVNVNVCHEHAHSTTTTAITGCYWRCVCQEFYHCRCIEGGSASLGACPRDCQAVFYTYVALQFITFVVSNVTVVPLMMSLVRSVLRLTADSAVHSLHCSLDCATHFIHNPYDPLNSWPIWPMTHDPHGSWVMGQISQLFNERNPWPTEQLTHDPFNPWPMTHWKTDPWPT